MSLKLFYSLRGHYLNFIRYRFVNVTLHIPNYVELWFSILEGRIIGRENEDQSKNS